MGGGGGVENFPHIFTGVFAILRYKDIHCTQTIYLAIGGSTYYSIPYLHRCLLGLSIRGGGGVLTTGYVLVGAAHQKRGVFGAGTTQKGGS